MSKNLKYLTREEKRFLTRISLTIILGLICMVCLSFAPEIKSPPVFYSVLAIGLLTGGIAIALL
jgi:hypothetical protein